MQEVPNVVCIRKATIIEALENRFGPLKFLSWIQEPCDSMDADDRQVFSYFECLFEKKSAIFFASGHVENGVAIELNRSLISQMRVPPPPD